MSDDTKRDNTPLEQARSITPDTTNITTNSVTWQLNALTEALGDLVIDIEDVVSIGRGKDNDIVLGSKQVSRQHARLTVLNGQVFVKDLGSSNGTFINDNRIDADKSKYVSDGDTITFATFSFALQNSSLSNTDNAIDVEEVDIVAAPTNEDNSVKDIADSVIADEVVDVEVVDSEVVDEPATSETGINETESNTKSNIDAPVVEVIAVEKVDNQDSKASTDTINDLTNDITNNITDIPTNIEQDNVVQEALVDGVEVNTEEDVSDIQDTEVVDVEAETPLIEDTVEDIDKAESVSVEGEDEGDDTDTDTVQATTITTASDGTLSDTEGRLSVDTSVAEPTDVTETIHVEIVPDMTYREIDTVLPEKTTEMNSVSPDENESAPIEEQYVAQDVAQAQPEEPEEISPVQTEESIMNNNNVDNIDNTDNIENKATLATDSHDKTTTTELQREADPDVLRAKQAATGQFSATNNLGAPGVGTHGNDAMTQEAHNPATHPSEDKSSSGMWFIAIFIAILIIGLIIWLL